MVFDMEVLTTRACEGNGVSREEALWLYNEVDLETLSQTAEKIRKAETTPISAPLLMRRVGFAAKIVHFARNLHIMRQMQAPTLFWMRMLC